MCHICVAHMYCHSTLKCGHTYLHLFIFVRVARASGKAGNGKWKRKWKRKMETEMDAENGKGQSGA